MSHEYVPSQTVQRILCCECGVPIEPNAANMCINCVRAQVDITEGIPKQITVNFCRGCDRYLQPPAQWLPCQLESKELLALLLRRLKGLNRVRLIDAGFIWTEPHSKRIKMKLTIQKEVFASTILQQTFVVESVVANQQCSDCARREAKNTWNTVVQVRQKVDHKRTFLYLEQLILKHQAHRDAVNIKVVRDGIDFYFNARSHAIKFSEFLGAVVPIRSKASEQLITQDTHSGESTYKFTYSVEIVPICKDDLVFLPSKLSRNLGGINPLVICTRVGTILHFIDPSTLATADIMSASYWRDPFTSLASAKDLVEYYVLDVERSTSVKSNGKYSVSEVTVARASDFGRNSQTYFARSHLGYIVKPGDIALGYDLSTSNFNNEEYTQYGHRHEIPDVILVRKSYSHLRRGGHRNWKLKQLAMDVDENEVSMAADRDMERFMQELEEDPELRSGVNMYRVKNATTAMDVVSEDEVPKVSIEELLEELSISEAEADS